MEIVLAGCTGFIGRELVYALNQFGHRCTVLIRSEKSAPAGYMPQGVLLTPYESMPNSADAVINLAGEPISGPWDEAGKKRIVDSRIDTTKRLVDWMEGLPAKPTVLLSASAVGFYGDRGDEVLTEKSGPDPSRQFLSQVCIGWEYEANLARNFGVRVVNLRLGNVIDPKGGFLPALVSSLRFLPVLSPYRPKGFVPWISLPDCVRAMLFAIENDSIRGPINLVSPELLTNRQLMVAMAKAMGRISFGTVPDAMIRLVVGPFSEAILASQKVLPQRLIDEGFTFADNDFESLVVKGLRKA